MNSPYLASLNHASRACLASSELGPGADACAHEYEALKPSSRRTIRAERCDFMAAYITRTQEPNFSRQETRATRNSRIGTTTIPFGLGETDPQRTPSSTSIVSWSRRSYCSPFFESATRSKDLFSKDFAFWLEYFPT